MIKTKITDLFYATVYYVGLLLLFTTLTGLFGFAITYGVSSYPTVSDKSLALFVKMEPKQFDFVTVQLEDGFFKERLCKRVIAMPGDSIEFKAGTLYVNDVLVEEEYAYYNPEFNKGTYNLPKTTLGEDEYFVLGDNRFDSNDSLDFGPVKRDQIKQVVVWWSSKHDS